jgi:hypothetical protein
MRAMSEKPLTPAAKLRLALALFESGVAMMRQKLRRDHPDASEAEVDRLLTAWLRTRPGAELGDAQGVPRPVVELPS